MFSQIEPCTLPLESPPQLLVIIDTEEEFDWAQPVSRQNTGVQHMEMLELVQGIFNSYGIKPCYVVDYPIVSQEIGYRLLKEYHRNGQCDIGAHLHPWVNPPFVEELTAANTYPGNLPLEVERAKLKCLKDCIDRQFEQNTTIYKAGRYGFGPRTEQILLELGFEVDVSICPPVDFGADGGPDYSSYSDRPFWFADRKLLEIPATGAFVGWGADYSQRFNKKLMELNAVKGAAIASRLRYVDRLMLWPEGFGANEHQRLVKYLLKRGSRVFTWTFHSTSLVPGNTAYVTNAKELTIFLDNFKRFFDFFFEQCKGVPSTPNQLRNYLLALQNGR